MPGITRPQTDRRSRDSTNAGASSPSDICLARELEVWVWARPEGPEVVLLCPDESSSRNLVWIELLTRVTDSQNDYSFRIPAIDHPVWGQYQLADVLPGQLWNCSPLIWKLRQGTHRLQEPVEPTRRRHWTVLGDVLESLGCPKLC